MQTVDRKLLRKITRAASILVDQSGHSLRSFSCVALGVAGASWDLTVAYREMFGKNIGNDFDYFIISTNDMLSRGARTQKATTQRIAMLTLFGEIYGTPQCPVTGDHK
jgi:hypothetical protein